MAETTYTYTISTDFPNAAVAAWELEEEIRGSSIIIAIDRVDVHEASDACDIVFKDALSAGDKTTLDGIVAAHDGVVTEPVDPPTTSDGKPIVSTWPTEGSETMIITPNFCDRTTWYESSTRVVDEVATCDNPGTYTQYSVANINLIDTYHGKLSSENQLVDDGGNSYRVVVKVNGVTKTEQDPHTGSGSDYTIDYAAGEIMFLTALIATDTVEVTYHYETGSAFTIKPSAEKILKIVKAEIQMSGDIEYNDTILFEVTYGGVPIRWTRYKTVADLYNEAQGVYPSLPALGGSSWRGMSQPVYVLPFVYMAVSSLPSSANLAIRVSLENNQPFAGTYATATFYCLTEDE